MLVSVKRPISFSTRTQVRKRQENRSLPSVLDRNFQMFDDDLSEELLRISEAGEIFSSENHSRQFGSTFAAKGGENNYLDKPFLEKVDQDSVHNTQTSLTFPKEMKRSNLLI